MSGFTRDPWEWGPSPAYEMLQRQQEQAKRPATEATQKAILESLTRMSAPTPYTTAPGLSDADVRRIANAVADVLEDRARPSLLDVTAEDVRRYMRSPP